MKRLVSLMCVGLGWLWLLAGGALALPDPFPQEYTPDQTGDVDQVGNVDGTQPLPAKTNADTTWIADWTFEGAGGACDDTGWVRIDNRIVNDGSNYWHLDTTFNGVNGIVNKAAILSRHDLCWGRPDDYGNNWDYSIVCKYQGDGATLSFSFVSDSEPGFDFFTVEADSAGASELLVNFDVDPVTLSPAVFRDQLLSYDGLQSSGAVSGLALPSYGLPLVTHDVYLRFSSDGSYSDEYPNYWGAACVIDNITITGTLAYAEDFEGALNPNVTLANTANAQPFGEWARLYPHISDNEKCTENTTCAWLWSDPQTPARDISMAFGPGGAVLHNWLDDIIVSPWVSLGSTPGALGTVLTWRRNPAQRTSQSCIAQGWSVRTLQRVDNTDTTTPGDSIDCVGAWGHTTSWNTFNSFVWGTNFWDMTSYVASGATQIQLRVRTADFQLSYLFSDPPPATWNPGPGPYNDRIRIGRRYLAGPVINLGIDTRTQAQECFPTELHPGICCGQHYRPNTDTSAPLYPYLFGTCAFSLSNDLAKDNLRPRQVIGDSIYVGPVVDARGVGGITSVKWYGAIVAGPHTGKAPAPWAVGANGFFEVRADSCKERSSGTWITDFWFVDLDDTYFRGGDHLLYFWLATDAAGAKTSSPEGITAATFPPASVAAAENLTAGLYELGFLPTIDWDAGYLARIAAHASGDLDPTAAEVANSSQRNCILYYQHYNWNRRSGTGNRTAFMYALDRLGYAGHYDVYDCQGYGNTCNQVGSRATVAQASGYALIIQDSGRGTIPDTPDGLHYDAEKINQCQWYRDYLAQGASGRAGTATLWMIGENTAAEKPTNPLFATDLGLVNVATDQGLAVNPDVVGIDSFTTYDACSMQFADDRFSLSGGCPSVRAYDTATAAGTATITHKYRAGATLGNGAIIMNKNVALKWNTVWMGFGWFDIQNAAGTPASPDPSISLLQKILGCVLPENCRRSPDPSTGTGGDDTSGLPRVSALYQNTPNPFNPTTTIRFDLSHDGHVELRIFDVAGHVVKTLVNSKQAAGRNRTVVWTGLDEAGARVASGVYFYQLVTDDYSATKKLVVMK